MVVGAGTHTSVGLSNNSTLLHSGSVTILAAGEAEFFSFSASFLPVAALTFLVLQRGKVYRVAPALCSFFLAMKHLPGPPQNLRPHLLFSLRPRWSGRDQYN